MNGKRRILITGSEGYLMKQLIAELKKNPQVEKIFGVDIVNESRQEDEKFIYIKKSVTELSFTTLYREENIDTVVHSAWTFNPTHDMEKQDEVDIGGTLNVINAAIVSGVVKHIVYLGSTTAFGQIAENEGKILKEEDWKRHAEKRLASRYRYSKNKAIIDEFFQDTEERANKLGVNIFWVRMAIVLGEHTNNVVNSMADFPFKIMFKAYGYDPPMQFVSEFDATQILYRATIEKWSGVVNVAGNGTIKYSQLIKLLDRRKFVLPSWLLNFLCWVGWNIRTSDGSLLKFPPSLLELVKHWWVADITKLKKEYGYDPHHSSVDAALQFKKALENPEK